MQSESLNARNLDHPNKKQGEKLKLTKIKRHT